MAIRALIDIIDILRVELPRLERDFAVNELGVFGSVVRGEAVKTSDIDILVGYAQPPTLFEFVRLQRYLSELLGSPVDLVMKSALKPHIGEQVLSELIPV